MERLYEHLASEHLDNERQMLFLTGPRQVGKTTTSLTVAEGRDRYSYLNWDNVDHQASIVAGPSGLAEVLDLTTLRDDRPVLILDEIHKYPGWRNLLKGFFDTQVSRRVSPTFTNNSVTSGPCKSRSTFRMSTGTVSSSAVR